MDASHRTIKLTFEDSYEDASDRCSGYLHKRLRYFKQFVISA